MKILIVYASTEGQTRKIVRYAFDRLAAEGHAVELIAAGDAEGLDPSAFDAAILAGSVHAGHYQEELVDYARAATKTLARMPTLFVSVSLAAAGQDDDDWEGLHQAVRRFVEATGWTPGRVEHVAGAFRFGEYDFFKYWAMRWIEAQKDEDTRPGTDKEYTDWEALARVLEDWTATAAAGR